MPSAKPTPYGALDGGARGNTPPSRATRPKVALEITAPRAGSYHLAPTVHPTHQRVYTVVYTLRCRQPPRRSSHGYEISDELEETVAGPHRVPRYAIEFERRAAQDLRGIEPGRQRKVIRDAIDELKLDARPNGCVKLGGGLGYRIRVGDYRVVYTVDDGEDVITVTKVGNRGHIYQRR
ncbi:type II toxin-antitoxin system RelE/ParE family toxin [Nocardia fusca]|uniref:type II toxin-antitoxin system RelE/ParE family toxin n=1 Tax=Nocardia fusca TaxID=941183 RepID=UPI0037C50D3B